MYITKVIIKEFSFYIYFCRLATYHFLLYNNILAKAHYLIKRNCLIIIIKEINT